MRASILVCIITIQLAVLSPTLQRSVRFSHFANENRPSSEASRTCNKIRNIKKLPFRRDEATAEAFKQLDPVYGEFRQLGDTIVPCLISKITDKTAMEDPSQAPHYGLVTVGDVAFWVMLDITGMTAEEALPLTVRQDYKERGRFAYLDWVRRDPVNRKTLQETVKQWYAKQSKTK
jgi:hypothetical protein